MFEPPQAKYRRGCGDSPSKRGTEFPHKKKENALSESKCTESRHEGGDGPAAMRDAEFLFARELGEGRVGFGAKEERIVTKALVSAGLGENLPIGNAFDGEFGIRQASVVGLGVRRYDLSFGIEKSDHFVCPLGLPESFEIVWLFHHEAEGTDEVCLSFVRVGGCGKGAEEFSVIGGGSVGIQVRGIAHGGIARTVNAGVATQGIDA